MFLLDVSLSMAFKEGTRNYDVPDSVKWRTSKNVFRQAFQKLRTTDYGALMSFAEYSKLEQDFTTNKKLLDDAIGGLRLRSGTAIYDAIVDASRLFTRRNGVNVIILLTDGVDLLSQNTKAQAIISAVGAKVPVYTIGLGFYPDPNDPNRVDIDTLKSIADATGAKSYFAPTAAQLDSIFTQIFKNIYTASCVLSYTTQDTCRTGDARFVDVSVAVGTSQVTEQTLYTLPDYRSRLQLSISIPDTVQDDATILIPIQCTGEIRGGELMNFQTELRFDGEYFDFFAVETNGTILENQVVSIASVIAGVYTIAGNAVMPARGVSYGNQDILFKVRLFVKHREKNASTITSVRSLNMEQHCQIISSGGSRSVMIQGCPERLRVSIDSTIVVESGSYMRIPIRLHDAIDVNQEFDYSFFVNYDAALLEFIKVEANNSVSRNLSINAVLLHEGRLLITASPGIPTDTSGVLLFLDFSIRETKESRIASLSLDELAIRQSCLPNIETSGDHILINGICERILSRRSGLSLSQNVPNPFGLASHSTSISFTLPVNATIRLDVIDSHGSLVETLANGEYTMGTHVVRFIPHDLPSGLYFYKLAEGTHILTRKMLWQP